jgi:iduronate 2-sulfatase
MAHHSLFLTLCIFLCKAISSSSSSPEDYNAATTDENSLGKRKPYQTNLLFIIFDDLRVELSIFGRLGIISPNFERLAARSVVFDQAYTQIAVCNPSRDSLLTGLRPDTVGTYGFQSTYHTYRNHMILPTRLKRSGYKTASFGKIRHWENVDNDVWDESDNNEWYRYQTREIKYMNSSVMPDKIREDSTFPDYYFATKAIETIKRLAKGPDYFMLAVGFKNPHLALHVPYKYFEMYRSRVHLWNATNAELRFPPSAPKVSYRCCAAGSFRPMLNEGAMRQHMEVPLTFINNTLSLSMHQELMWVYAAMITFVDVQLGRILDAIDEIELWGNLTVVLTADHGMHLGEKGIWYEILLHFTTQTYMISCLCLSFH